MSELAELELFLRLHGKPIGTKVAPYQAKHRSPMDDRLNLPPGIQAAAAEFSRLLHEKRVWTASDGSIAYADDVDQSQRDRFAAADAAWIEHLNS